MNNLLDYCINEVTKIKTDKSFIVKDLFKGYEWMEMEVGVRIELGRQFYDAVMTKKVNLVPDGKTSSNQQKYKKIV